MLAGWASPGGRAALIGGALALFSTLLMPLHLGGGSGVIIGLGFAGAGVALAGASVALGAADAMPRRARPLRPWALLGAAGFLVSAVALLADLLGWSMTLSEVVAVLAVGAWWSTVGGHLLVVSPRRQSTQGTAIDGRSLGVFSLLCAGVAMFAIVVQFAWDAPAGAVPARFAYLLWGPWGIWLATRLARTTEPV